MAQSFFYRLMGFFLLIAAIACNQTPGDKKTVTKLNPCGCQLTDDEVWKQLPVIAIGDSIAICKTGTLVHFGKPFDGKAVDWLTAIKEPGILISDGLIGNLTDCVNGKELKTSFYEYHIKYRDKKIITESYFNFDSLANDGKWITAPAIDVYREIFYAEKGKIKKTEPELIIQVPHYNTAAIKAIHAEIKRNVPAYEMDYSLQKKVLVAAMNGDSLSRTILTTHVPSENMEVYQLYLRMLKDFDARRG